MVQLAGARGSLPGAAFRRPAAARGAGPGAGDRALASCCWTSPSPRSTARCGSTCRSRSSGCSAQLGLTAILVTHDQEEAMSVADRIAVMRRGRIEQLGTPVEVYDRPAHALRRRLHRHHQPAALHAGRRTATAWWRCAWRMARRCTVPADSPPPPGPALLTVRPEQLELRDEAGPGLLPGGARPRLAARRPDGAGGAAGRRHRHPPDRAAARRDPRSRGAGLLRPRPRRPPGAVPTPDPEEE